MAANLEKANGSKAWRTGATGIPRICRLHLRGASPRPARSRILSCDWLPCDRWQPRRILRENTSLTLKFQPKP